MVNGQWSMVNVLNGRLLGECLAPVGEFQGSCRPYFVTSCPLGLAERISSVWWVCHGTHCGEGAVLAILAMLAQ
jgi:hypothetical protein